MNTDAEIYGGAGGGNGGAVTAHELEGGGVAARMTLPPLATIMLEYEA
jgi:1,4-alpha-glucan branching enzyme